MSKIYSNLKGSGSSFHLINPKGVATGDVAVAVGGLYLSAWPPRDGYKPYGYAEISDAINGVYTFALEDILWAQADGAPLVNLESVTVGGLHLSARTSNGYKPYGYAEISDAINGVYTFALEDILWAHRWAPLANLESIAVGGHFRGTFDNDTGQKDASLVLTVQDTSAVYGASFDWEAYSYFLSGLSNNYTETPLRRLLRMLAEASLISSNNAAYGYLLEELEGIFL